MVSADSNAKRAWLRSADKSGSGSTLRLARLGRLMRAFPELVALIEGVRQAARAVGLALFLLDCLICIFSFMVCVIVKDETHPESQY